MALDRGSKGAIIWRWMGILAGVGLVGAAGYGAWEFLQQQGGTSANPLAMVKAAARVGVMGAAGGAGVGLVWGALVALIRG